MQKKLIIEKKDLDKTAIILVKDLNNILRCYSIKDGT